MAPLRRVLLLALPFLLAACASAGGSGTASPEDTREERAGPDIAVTVRNSLTVPAPITVRIRPELGGGIQILGNVSPGREQTFRFRPQLVRGSYRLTARATGGGDITSTPFQLGGISAIHWDVQSNAVRLTDS